MRVSIRGKRLSNGPDLREEMQLRSRFALGRFRDVIRQVTVHLNDMNGRRGGINNRSQIVVVLNRGEQVIAEATEVTIVAIFDRARHRIKRLVSRAVRRRNNSLNTRSVPP